MRDIMAHEKSGRRSSHLNSGQQIIYRINNLPRRALAQTSSGAGFSFYTDMRLNAPSDAIAGD